MSKKSKGKEYSCGQCGEEFKTTKEMAKHYRKKHPLTARHLFDVIGTIGDKFADQALSDLNEALRNVNNSRDMLMKENTHMKAELAKLSFKYEQAANVVNAINALASNASAAIRAADNPKG